MLDQPRLIFRVREIPAFCYLYRGSMEINLNQILSIALATVPTMLTVLIGILINNSRLGDVNSRIGDVNSRINDLRSNIDDLRSNIDNLRSNVDSRINDLRSHMDSRVEEVLDARLKHLEER